MPPARRPPYGKCCLKRFAVYMLNKTLCKKQQTSGVRPAGTRRPVRPQSSAGTVNQASSAFLRAGCALASCAAPCRLVVGHDSHFDRSRLDGFDHGFSRLLGRLLRRCRLRPAVRGLASASPSATASTVASTTGSGMASTTDATSTSTTSARASRAPSPSCGHAALRREPRLALPSSATPIGGASLLVLCFRPGCGAYCSTTASASATRHEGLWRGLAAALFVLLAAATSIARESRRLPPRADCPLPPPRRLSPVTMASLATSRSTGAATGTRPLLR